MPVPDDLSERELQVLEAVVQCYIETAEPAGSHTLAHRYGLGVSPATVRSVLGDLETKGYLFHRHTSAGRIPTDLGYRAYVDQLARRAPPSSADQLALRAELKVRVMAVDDLLRRAAQVLGVLTQELGVAVGPAFDQVVLERVELVQAAFERLLLVLNLRSGVVRSIFVRVPGNLSTEAVEAVGRVLNERLAGLSLAAVRATLPDRLRDAAPTPASRELLDIFIAEGDDLFERAASVETVHLGSAEPLTGQPEFASNDRMRSLLRLTERRDVLREALETRRRSALTVTIGGENGDERLADFTLVTAPYRQGGLTGVLGVIGPTRMPYEKIIGLVEHTSRLVEGLLE